MLAGSWRSPNNLRVISASQVVVAVLPVYLIIVAGMAARRTGIMRVEHDEGVMRLVYSVMMPCYILDKILGSPALRSGSVVVSSFCIGFCLVLGGVGIGALVGWLIGLKKGDGARTFALSSGAQNFGFTAVPVVEILWPVGALGVLFIHNLGVELAMWSVGVMILTGEKGVNWRRLVNGPVVAVALGLLLLATGLDDKITGPERKVLSLLGAGAFPVGVFITGCTIMDLIGSERPTLKIVSGSALVRLCLAPLLFLAAAKWLPVAVELKQVLVVQAAMPAAMTPIILARLYGGRPAVAVQIVVFTTALSLLTLPWIISFGSSWIGLTPLK